MPSSKHPPANVIPQTGKSFDDDTKSSGTKVRTVFREDIPRLYLFNNSEHLKPKARTRPGKSFTFTDTADVLTGESSGNNIDKSSPRFPVERRDVVPDRECGQVPVSLSLE
tara:strand:- start:377 stop:709 length:333 start_codon:yes stop_codon:yes gene_type:complete